MTQIDLSAARYIVVDPVLAMSEFIGFGPEGQSDWRHSMGVHGVAVMHRVSPSPHLQWKTSAFVSENFRAEP